MISQKQYIISSLELHLFFGRIMKEHSIFLEAGFTPKNGKLSKEAENYKVHFEKLLLETIKLSNGILEKSFIDSGEIFTDYTLNAEKKTQCYTGININSKITTLEKELPCEYKGKIDLKTVKAVKDLNCKAKKLISGLIALKRKILDGMLNCTLFTMNYPLLIEHIIQEAELYYSYIETLDNNEDIKKENIEKVESFWNHIMMEHALFIRGLLDPDENILIETSDEFAKEYKELLEDACKAKELSIDKSVDIALEETVKLRDFKRVGTEGIIDCKIKSVILPLLADHVLREANHYIRILNSYKNQTDD